MSILVNGVVLPNPKCRACGYEFDEGGSCLICKRCSGCCCCIGPERFVDATSRRALAREREKYAELQQENYKRHREG